MRALLRLILLFGVKPVAAYRNVHRLVGGLR